VVTGRPRHPRAGALLSGIFFWGQVARQTTRHFWAKILSPNLILRSAVPFLPTAFHRLLEPLDRRVLKRIIDEHGGNRGVGEKDGAWTCQRHLKALLFAQFAGLKSLREIEQALAARPAALYHLGLRPPRRATLSDASALRPAAVFRDLCQSLMGTLARGPRQEGQALIRLLDASPIPLRDGRFTWAEADARCRGLKLHILHDPRAVHPVHFAVTSPKVSDVTAGREMPLEAGATYVFDKGYTDYNWWQDIVETGALFVTRLKSNVRRRDLRDNPAVGIGILEDRKLKIGHKKPRGGANNALYNSDLREVVVAREGKAPLHLVTNDHSRSAIQIAELYKERWQIELFFKWIKQNLKVKTFLGRSENAVKIQIYVALIAFFLLRLFQNSHASSHKDGAKALMARLKVALFDQFDLTNRATPPPRPPQNRHANPQFTLQLGTQP
jgi:putative transposase